MIDLEMKEENNLFCANPTAEDNLDEEIIDSVTYNGRRTNLKIFFLNII